MSIRPPLKWAPLFEGDPLVEDMCTEPTKAVPQFHIVQQTIDANPTTCQTALTTAAPQPRTGVPAAQADRELDIKYELLTLNKDRDANKVVMQALMYELHKLMAGNGREGKFASFLRNELGWTGDYARTKASRWIAAHELRVGLINNHTYDKRMGNGSATLRSASPAPAERSPAPTLHQTFTIEHSGDDVDLEPPSFTPEEITADIDVLEGRKGSFYRSVLLRAYYPVHYVEWFHSAWKTQARRHGTKTFADTVACVMFTGSKPAAQDDEWDQCFDEILRDIGRNPALASQPDFVHPEDREEVATTGSSNASASIACIGTAVPTRHELTLDDFDDDLLVP